MLPGSHWIGLVEVATPTVAEFPLDEGRPAAKHYRQSDSTGPGSPSGPAGLLAGGQLRGDYEGTFWNLQGFFASLKKATSRLG